VADPRAELDQLGTPDAPWLKSYRRATADAYARDFRSWLIWCRRNNVDPLAPAVHLDAQRWLDQLAAFGRRPASLRRALYGVSAFYRWAVRSGMVRRQPMPPADRIWRRHRTGAPRILTLSETYAVLRAAREHSPRMHAFAAVTAYCGLRVTDVLALESTDRRRLPDGRPGLYLQRQDSTIPLAAPAAAAVDAYLAGRTGPVFATATGRRVSRGQAADMLAWCADRAAVPNVNTEVLRRAEPILAAAEDQIPAALSRPSADQEGTDQ
jgi:site-specific recombinase XerD